MRITRSQTMSQRATSTQERTQTKSIAPNESSTRGKVTYTKTILKRETSTIVTYSKITKRHTRADSGIRKTTKRSYAEYNEDIKNEDFDTSNEHDELFDDGTELAAGSIEDSIDIDESAYITTGGNGKPRKGPKVQRVSMSEAIGGEIVEPEEDHYIIRFIVRKLKNKYAPVPKHRKTNGKNFAFNHNPLWHRGYTGPTPTQVHNVLIILTKHHKMTDNVDFPLDPSGIIAGADSKVERPGHAPIGITIDNVAKVIFSQSTSNTIATRLHDRLCELFQYDVDGQSYVGTVPNYHKMLICSEEDMAEALHIGGLYKGRAKSMISILNNIYAANCERVGLDNNLPSYNEPGARDFVPGLLSMDYLNGMKKGALMDHLLGMDGIGVKSAACILAFNFGLPVFAVDTHVLSMTRQLGWIPEICADEDAACMALDPIIPDLYKYSLHQAFWHHRIKCGRCSGTTTQAVCPLEHLMNRAFAKNPKSSAKKVKEDGVNETTAEKAKKRRLEKSNAGVRTKPSIVPFHKMRAEKAAADGYVLVKESIDNDFGVSAVKQHYVSWHLKEKALPTKIVSMEDAVANQWIPAKPVKRESGQSTLTSFVIKKEVVVEEEEE